MYYNIVFGCIYCQHDHQLACAKWFTVQDLIIRAVPKRYNHT